jgi:hypothetical protein
LEEKGDERMGEEIFEEDEGVEDKDGDEDREDEEGYV